MSAEALRKLAESGEISPIPQKAAEWTGHSPGDSEVKSELAK